MPIEQRDALTAPLSVTTRMILCGVVAAASLTVAEGFSFDEAGILVNETAGTLSVTYSARVFVSQDGTRYCGIPSDLFLGAAPTREGKVGGGIRPPSMRGVVFNKTACTASFQLGPSQAAYNVFHFGLCADHEKLKRKYARDFPDLPWAPDIESLSITAGGHTHVWRGWAAVEQFERSPNGDCVFRFSAR